MTHRLLQIAEDQWAEIDGYGVAHGFDPVDLSLTRLCNFVWWRATENADKSEVDKFRVRLWRPPKGQEVDHAKSPWSADAEMEAFASLKSALGGKANSR